MEFKSNPNIGTASGAFFNLAGCANGVEYVKLVPVSACACPEDVVQYVNLETGGIELVEPVGFTVGACSSLADGKVCYNLSGVAYSKITANGSTLYFREGVAQTSPSQIAAAAAAIGTATPADVVCCPDCDAVPADLISADAPNSLILGTDGKLYVAPPQAMINDDQVLSGDNSTNVTLTFVPTTVPDPENAAVDQVNYVIKAEVKVDGTTIVEDPATKVLSAANQKPDALTTVQPTPTATGNTTNLNTIFTDGNGVTWFVDFNGDAVQMSSPVFKEANRIYVDPNGANANSGGNEAPKLTIAGAVAIVTQGDNIVVNEGVYSETVTINLQNTALSGASSSYGSMSSIAAITVATASGTSNKISDLTVTGTLERTGNAPLYLNSVTVNGNVTLAGTAYTEIRGSRLQDGSITVSGASTLLIESSKIGTSTFSTAGSAILLRNVTIDAGDTVTIGAGVVYSLQDVTGNVVIDPAAVNVEAALILAGLSPALAEGAVTTHFHHIRMLNADLEANPTQVVTRDPVTGELEVSNFPEPLKTTTSLVPKVYQGAAFTDAQANANANVADAFLLSDGTYFNAGRLKYVGHGYTVGMWYYLDQTTPGAVTNVKPLTGLSQQLFFVEDAAHLLVNIEQTIDPVTPEFANVVYVNALTPTTATIFDLLSPPTVHDPDLDEDSSNLYVGTDGTVYLWNGTAYITRPNVSKTEWYLGSTTIDAEGNKTSGISRAGWVKIGENADPAAPIDVHRTGVSSNLLVARFLAPANNVPGNGVRDFFGVSQTTKNAAERRFVYAGDGSDLNRYDIGFFGLAPNFSTLAGGFSGFRTQSPLSTVDVNGSFGAVHRSPGASVTSSGDHTVNMITAGTTVTLEAPGPVSRRIMVIKNSSTGLVTVTGLIDSLTSRSVILQPVESMVVQSIGTRWIILADYRTPLPLLVVTNLQPRSIPQSFNSNLANYASTTNTFGGAWSDATGIFTVPRTGVYRFDMQVTYASAAWTLNNDVFLNLLVNGAIRTFGPNYITTAGTQIAKTGVINTAVLLNTGDTVQMRLFHNLSGAAKTTGSALLNTLTIHEVR